ncbi:oligosaccharide flippase family protein [bacterium]|nr:oligosaccharide flippase family protein [bacterium]
MISSDDSARGQDAAGPATALRAKAVRGLKFASFGTVGKTAVDMAAQLVLVRVLAEEHFGVFAIAQALTGFISCFSEVSGLKFLIRDKDDDRRAVSTVFWFELSLGLLVAGAWAIACAPLLEFLGKPEQIPFARALAIWIVAERLMLPRAVLDRALRFGRVNLAQFSGVAIGSGALVVSALAGLGAWTFIVGLIARTVATATFMWIAAGFVPLLAFDRETLRRLFVFGGPLMFTTALTFAYTNVDYLIVEQAVGYTMVGLYYAAYRYPHYLNQFNVILTGVVFPSFTKTRDDAHLARGLRLVTRYAAVIAFLPVILMWTEGDALIRWLIGEKWIPALFPFQCFTTLAAMRLAFVHWGQVYIARGRTKALLGISIVNLPLIAGSAWLGVRLAGIEGAAIGVTAASLATLAFCCNVLLKRLLKFSYGEALSPVIYATLASLLVLIAGRYVTPATDIGAAVRLIAGGAVYGLVILGLCASEIRRVLGKAA